MWLRENKMMAYIYRIGQELFLFSVVTDADVNVLGITGPEDTMILNK